MKTFLAILITAIIAGGIGFFSGTKMTTITPTAQPEIATKQDTALISKLPVYCSPSGETLKSELKQFNKVNFVDVYYLCGDLGFTKKHVLFKVQQNSDQTEEALYYSFDNQELAYQLKDKEQHTITGKSDIEWSEFKNKDLGDNPVKLLDLTLDGKELQVLGTPIELQDGSQGTFQSSEFTLTDSYKGLLTIKDREFEINFEQNTVKELK